MEKKLAEIKRLISQLQQEHGNEIEGAAFLVGRREGQVLTIDKAMCGTTEFRYTAGCSLVRNS